MTSPQDFDPARIASEALARGGIPGISYQEQEPEDPRALVEQVVQAVAQLAPAGWQQIHAAFSLAGAGEIASVVAITPTEPQQIRIPVELMEPVRRHRLLTIGEQGPWFRLLFDCDSEGNFQVAFDYGDNEFPADQLLPSDEYLRDYQEFPRPDAPVWLLAYMANDGHQLRSPAAAYASAERNSDPALVQRVDDELPPLPALWARMAALAAMCHGSDAPVGPSADPSFQLYIGENGGCTLSRLPDGRGVLSGGRDDSPLLSAGYKGLVAFPDLYRGAPVWLHTLYLDPRAGRGMLSFCYWWEHNSWYRSALPEADSLRTQTPAWNPTDEIARGVPGVWTIDTTVTLVTAVLKRIGVELTDRNHYSALDFVRACEAGIASEGYVRRMFLDGIPESFSLAEALAQLDATGVLLPRIPPISKEAAIAEVRKFCRDHGVDTVGYPMDTLSAARIDGGWQVYAPIEPGSMGIGRMYFLAADDGVVEKASTSRQPGEIEFIFASRFAERVRGRRTT
ncbi:hypothetical protein BKG69_23265 [Mycobacteroides chelonae]|uniref:hypothetical protein n=1 Tax=Mycobacteroides TaxID=670516 RepID=UPI0008A9FEF3|nr:hypothetical protein [Mycobacteroides chelonae]OHT77311.1 hypothetical protein BKG69_23265 [Mycobacteroides chelonae]GLE55284.1 hypothetical protein NJBCHELONAE_05950 [Mycobacteroides chelonae]